MTVRNRWGQTYTGLILAAGFALATTNCSANTNTTAPTPESVSTAPAGGLSGINLALSTAGSSIASGKTGLQTFTIANSGTTTQGASILTYVTPFYVNIDRGRPLPAGCSFRLEDPDPTVPEVVRCTTPAGLEQNKEVQLSIPVEVTTRTRFVGTNRGMAIVAPAQGSPDKETDLTDNVARPIITVIPPSPELPNATVGGLYGTADHPAMAPDQRKLTTFSSGNAGPNDMTGEVTITYLTPFYVNVDRGQPLPAGCGFRLEDPDPTIPEMVTCKRPALTKGKEDQVQFPLVALPGGPRGTQIGGALVAPASASDVDFDQIDNITPAGAQIISPLP